MAEQSEPKVRADGRKQFLTVMQPNLIVGVKTAALEEGKTAYEIVEIAVTEYLEARKMKK